MLIDDIKYKKNLIKHSENVFNLKAQIIIFVIPPKFLTSMNKKIIWSWHFLQVFYSTTDNFLWWVTSSSSCISNLKSRNKERATYHLGRILKVLSKNREVAFLSKSAKIKEISNIIDLNFSNQKSFIGIMIHSTWMHCRKKYDKHIDFSTSWYGCRVWRPPGGTIVLKFSTKTQLSFAFLPLQSCIRI